jgi:hypothetical protein
MFETWNSPTHPIALIWLLLQPWIVEVLHIRSVTPFWSIQYFIHLEVFSTSYFTSHPLNGLIKLCNILSRILTLDALWSQLIFNRLFCNCISFNFKFMQVDSHRVREMLKCDSGLDIPLLEGPPIAKHWTVDFLLLYSLEWNWNAIFRGIWPELTILLGRRSLNKCIRMPSCLSRAGRRILRTILSLVSSSTTETESWFLRHDERPR